MPHPNHTIVISDVAITGPTLAQGGDTVQWQALSSATNDSGVSKATVTFTGSNPLHPSFTGGSLMLSGGQESSKFTVNTSTKPGNYAFEVVVGEQTFKSEIQVLGGDVIIVPSDPD